MIAAALANAPITRGRSANSLEDSHKQLPPWR
jgi:hypothetical protein